MTLPPILVTGGTGTLGRQVVARLADTGREVRVLSRRSATKTSATKTSATKTSATNTGATNTGATIISPAFVTGDLATGAGLAAAVRGAGTIVHCASSRKGDAGATRNLVQAVAQENAAQGSEPPHLVYISIVGVDRFPRGYYKAKLAAEAIVAGSGLPWTTLRATQFYELIRGGAQRLAKLPAIPVPAGFSVQPVDSGEVAARLAELALGEPSGRVPDMAGPQVLSFADVIRTYLTATGRRAKPVMPVWIPGLGPIRAGALYPPSGSDALIGHRTWPEFLGASHDLSVTVRIGCNPV